MDEIRLTSTTDTEAEVRAALGLKDPAPTPATVVPVKADDGSQAATSDAETKTPAVEAKPAATPQTEAEKASEAGRKLSEKKGRLQSRIDDLTRERHTSLRERDAALQQAETLRKELDALKATKPAAEAKPAAETKIAAAESTDRPVKPKEDDFPVFADYEAAKEKYEEALIDWKADARVARLREELKAEQETERKRVAEEQARAEARSAQQKFADKQKVARTKHADFDEALDKGKDLPAPPWVRDHLGESEIGAELQYYLATHPAETIEIAGLSPSAAVKRLLSLELKHEAGTLFAVNDDDDDDPPETAETNKSAPKAVPVSHAPAPGGRVASGSATPVFDPNSPNVTQKEFNAWREKQRQASGANRRGLL